MALHRLRNRLGLRLREEVAATSGGRRRRDSELRPAHLRGNRRQPSLAQLKTLASVLPQRYRKSFVPHELGFDRPKFTKKHEKYGRCCGQRLLFMDALNAARVSLGLLAN